MLNDDQIRNFKPIHKLYRVADSHGLCIEINLMDQSFGVIDTDGKISLQ